MGSTYFDENEAADGVWRALARAGYLPITYVSDGFGEPAVIAGKLAPSRVEAAENAAREALADSGFAMNWYDDCDGYCATDHTTCEECSRPRSCGAVIYDPDKYKPA